MGLRLILPYALLTAAIAVTLGAVWFIEPDIVPIVAIVMAVSVAFGYLISRA